MGRAACRHGCLFRLCCVETNYFSHRAYSENMGVIHVPCHWPTPNVHIRCSFSENGSRSWTVCRCLYRCILSPIPLSLSLSFSEKNPTMQINLKQAILDFNANSGELSPGALMKQAECLLTNPDLTRTLKGMDPGNQKSFLDNVDKVCQIVPLFENPWRITSVKAYPTLDDFERVITLGDLCSVVAQLPTSAKLSGVRETPLNLSFKCGRSTVVIPGELDGKGVAIKSFHTPLNAIEKENFQNVSKWLSKCEVRS